MRLIVPSSFYKWLWRTRSPKKHWPGMIFRFWEHVWVKHEDFDRKKGRLTTWLGWRWMAYYTACTEHGKKFGDPPLPGSESSGPGRGALPKMKFFSVAGGLNPEWHALPDWSVAFDDNTYEKDRKKLRGSSAPSSYAEKILSTDTVDLNSKEEERVYQEERLKQLSRLLSPAERRLLNYVRTNRTTEEVAEIVGLSTSTTGRMIRDLKSHLKSLAG